MSHSILQGADLSQTKLLYPNFEKANLSKTNLPGANLGNTYMPGANLQDADLSQANLSEANIDRADLSRANLQGAKNLNPDQVKRVKNWDKAKYDANFREKLGLKESK